MQAAGDSVAAVEPESVKGASRNAEQAIRAWACPVGTSITVKVKRARFTCRVLEAAVFTNVYDIEFRSAWRPQPWLCFHCCKLVACQVC